MATEPTPIDLVRELREALGLFAGAMPITPKQAWEEALERVRGLTEGRCHVCMAKERNTVGRPLALRRTKAGEALMATGTPTPLCGDEACESPGCDPAALDAWDERMTYEAKRLIRPWAVTDDERERFG